MSEYDPVKPVSYPLSRVILHWLIALTIIGLFVSGLWIVRMDYYDALYTLIPHWHKSIGLILMFILVLSVFLRRLTPKPEYDASLKAYERIIAGIVQSLMSILCFAVIISGYFITSANGDPVSVFNWFELPAYPLNVKNQEDIAGELHEIMAFALIGLAMLHAGAALYHHFGKKDRTLLK
ncbi:MAG: cytochrome b, partial [Gammaproteobacteria bacterium]|nr:cytochrome b [Gammaproteobacteria bacterium]NNM12751.1 cytochrome b [Gammaproteobacteria bacterium]